MTIRRGEDGTIFLEEVCPVEDAEPLLQMLLATPQSPIDWTQCLEPHTAVVQVLIAAGTIPPGPCGDGWIRQWWQRQG
jgi:hypothetical protein